MHAQARAPPRHGRTSRWVRPAAVGVGVVLLAVVLAGCTGPGPGGDGGDGAGPYAFTLRASGDRALGFAEDQMRWPDGSVRYRIPGTPGNDATATMLVENWTKLGWTASWQTFDGPTFLALQTHPTIEDFTEPPHCDADERARLRNLTFHNVVARLGPPGGPDRPEVILGAHYDTKRFATMDQQDPTAPVPGADDGASGVAVLWELARVLPGRTRNVTVTLVAFDGEDGWEECHPSAGAAFFADQLAEDAARRDAVTAVVILDMVGNASARFPKEGYGRQAAPDLVDFLWDEAARQGAARFGGTAGSVGDDHLPFLHHGMPAADIIHLDGEGRTVFPPYWHTTEDTLDKLDAGTLQEVGRVAEAFVLLADRGVWPGGGAPADAGASAGAGASLATGG